MDGRGQVFHFGHINAVIPGQPGHLCLSGRVLQKCDDMFLKIIGRKGVRNHGACVIVYVKPRGCGLFLIFTLGGIRILFCLWPFSERATPGIRRGSVGFCEMQALIEHIPTDVPDLGGMFGVVGARGATPHLLFDLRKHGYHLGHHILVCSSFDADVYHV